MGTDPLRKGKLPPGYSLINPEEEDKMVKETTEVELASISIAIKSAEKGTLTQRDQVYRFLAAHCQLRVEEFKTSPRGADQETAERLVYYKVADLSRLLEESGAAPSGILRRKIRDMADLSGEVNQERFLRVLEERGRRESKDYVGTIVDYCQKQSGTNPE